MQRIKEREDVDNDNIHILCICFCNTMENVVVTGGAGFIGVQLLKKLLSMKLDKIIVIDNLSNMNKTFSYLLNSNSYDKLSFYKADIRNKKEIFDIIKDEQIDTCIHLAAIVSVPDSINNPEYTIDVNINGTFNVLDACSRTKVRNFVFSSSCAVYGVSNKMPLSENDPLLPLSPYGASKAAGEALVSSYGRTQKIQNAISLRFFNVYGENQNPQYAGVITKFIEELSKGSAPTIFGDGEQTRDFIHVIDVVDAIISASSAKHVIKGVHVSRNGGSSLTTFNVGTGCPTSINELAGKLIKIFGLNLKPIFSNMLVGEMKHCYADTKSSRKFLNFVAKENFDSRLAQMVDNIKHIR
jgi:UDP-glucose 4-epimerase